MFFTKHRGLLLVLIIQHHRLDLSFCGFGAIAISDSPLVCIYMITEKSVFRKMEYPTEMFLSFWIRGRRYGISEEEC